MSSAPVAAEINDIGQITASLMGHLRANPEIPKRTENVIDVFLGGALKSIEPDMKTALEAEDEGAPPEAIGLAAYYETKKKELLAAGYSLQQASMILMGQLGALSVYTGIANNEKKISIVRRVMAHQVRKSLKEQELEQAPGKLSTTLGKTTASPRERNRFAMRGQGHRTR